MARRWTLSRVAGAALISAGAVCCLATVGRAQGPAPQGASALVGEGRDTFNGNCAHCHGGDATQTDDARNLRRLKSRYGADAKLAFDTTLREGRLGTLMQSWNDTFGEDEYRKIWAWLQTVQAKD